LSGPLPRGGPRGGGVIDQSQNFGFTVSQLRNTMSPQLQSRDWALIESKHYMWRLCPEILVNPSGFLSSDILRSNVCKKKNPKKNEV
jgi:hypothetical protein